MWQRDRTAAREEWQMKKKIWILMLIISAAILASCGNDAEEEEEYASFVYYLNGDANGLVRKEYDIPDGETQEQAEQILEKLKEPSDDLDYINPIPEDVEVLGSALTGSILDVDFSEAYLDIGRIQEKLVRAAVVQSLVQIDGINAVRFMIAGEPFKDSSGMETGLMNEDDFVGNTSSSPSSYQTDTLTLYFASETGDRLVEQKTMVRYSSNVSKDKLIVEKLMQGPSGDDVRPTINPNANLLSVTTKDDICYVNFDSTFLTGEYDILPELTIYSIVNSLIEGTEAKQVQITINGESNAEYMETVDLSQPLSENPELLAVKDDE